MTVEAGGLTAGNEGAVLFSSATGKVEGYTVIGMLAGYNNGFIYGCYSDGVVYGDQWFGGLIGVTVQNGAIVSNCYSSGSVTGTGDRIGGLMGYNSGANIINCYSTCSVNGASETGGLIGLHEEFIIQDSYFLHPDDGGGPDNGFGTPLTDSEMRMMSSFSNWDFYGLPEDGYRDFWKMSEGGGYPALSIFDSPVPYPLNGNGTEGNPYQVGSLQDLIMISWYPKFSYFQLANDIDLAGEIFIDALVPFLGGSLDGNDKTVSNVEITGSSYLGLFGFILSGSEVHNLTLKDILLTVEDYAVGGNLCGMNFGDITHCLVEECEMTGGGGICGESYVTISDCSVWDCNIVDGSGLCRENYGDISDCSVKECNISGSGGLCGNNQGSITSSQVTGQLTCSGGLAGSNSGTISNCYTRGELNGNGGLVEYNYGYIEYCHSSMDVNGESSVGGLSGSNGGTIISSYATGNISGTNGVGGLVGNNNNLISECYSTGNVIGNEKVGGLVGSDGGYILNCYAIGSVTGETSTGGFIGELVNNHYVLNCYSTGAVSGGGGFAGYIRSGDIVNCFWDMESSGTNLSAGGVGIATEAMKKKITYSSSGWLFIEDGESGIWAIAEGFSYPVLTGVYNHSGGDGSEGNPYIISSVMDLLLVDANPEGYFYLANDLDLSGVELSDSVIGAYPNNPFTGVFEGAGHVVRNVSISNVNSNHKGLFGYVSGNEAEINNLGVENLTLQAHMNDYVGGLVGYLEDGKIENCFVAGLVSGRDFVGGFVGYNLGGTVKNCYSKGMTEGVWCVGGFAGWNWEGTIEKCCTASGIWGLDYVGAFLGYQRNGALAGCFWNSDLAGPVGYGGEVSSIDGMFIANTEDMKEQDTFTAYAGWDFVGEDVNGMEDQWRMCVDGVDYPRLWWEFGADVTCGDGVDYGDFGVVAGQWLMQEGGSGWYDNGVFSASVKNMKFIRGCRRSGDGRGSSRASSRPGMLLRRRCAFAVG